MSSQIEHRISSQIQRVVRDGVVVFKKQYTSNDWDGDFALVQQRARREVDIIRQIEESGRFDRRLGVVRIANADPDTAAIATYEIKGGSLDEFIFSGGDNTSDLTPWFLAGRWLREFQSLPVSSEKAGRVSNRDPNDIVEFCDFRLRSLSDYGFKWPNESTRHSLVKTIETFRGQSENADHEPVWVHADYAPGNLMWDGHVLTPIDFAMVRKGDPLEDATYLIHRIEMQRVYRPWLKLPVNAIRQAILRGLGQPNAEQSNAYKMLMIKHLICRLHTYVRRPAENVKQSVHDRWVRTIVRHRLQAAISQEPGQS